MLTGWLTQLLPLIPTFQVPSFFWDAVLGGIIVSVVSALLNRFVVSAAA